MIFSSIPMSFYAGVARVASATVFFVAHPLFVCCIMHCPLPRLMLPFRTHSKVYAAPVVDAVMLLSL